MFTDHVKLTLTAGRGGNGVVAWSRAKFIPKGGPCGGDGGKGGSIIIKTSKDLFSLDAYRNTTLVKAENGADGMKNRWKGKSGKDKTLIVPLGTLILDADTEEIIADLTEENQTLVLCEGGKGGLGNNHFKTPTNQTPTEWTPGKPGKTAHIALELKLIADVGFVGLPNAGKSTLLSALTPNKVKIGNYPFTTLKPNLSFIEFDDYSRIFLADIPGIIKDAHKGRGLGLEFLKHIERSSALVYVIDAAGQDGRNPLDDFFLLQNELKLHDPKLLDKPFLVALNKADLEEARENIEIFKAESKVDPASIFVISAELQDNLNPLSMAMKSLAQRVVIRFK